MFLAKEPFFDGEESGLAHGPGAVEGGGRTGALGARGDQTAAAAARLVRRVAAVGALPVNLVVRHGRREGHAIIIGNLKANSSLFTSSSKATVAVKTCSNFTKDARLC